MEESSMPPTPDASATRAQAGPNPWLLICIAVYISWGFGYETVWLRLVTEIDGVILSAQYHPATSRERAFTDYVVQDAKGEHNRYVAGPTDASLPRDLPVGTCIQKKRWEIGYMRNGTRVDDFPVYFYMGVLGIALGCLTWAVLQWLSRGGPSYARAKDAS
jgi:hypothetical protein